MALAVGVFMRVLACRSGVVRWAMPAKKSKSNEQTSQKVASTASDILRDPDTSKDAKSVAGSALAQAPAKPKKKSAR